jgi:N-acyl-phosphatidylethanolamine-hydrolysing phospholipase D
MTHPKHHSPTGGFHNPWPDSEPHGFVSLLRWFAERHTTKRPAADPHPSVFPRVAPRLGASRHDGDLAVTWMGHSSVLIEFGGFRVLTDPVWGTYASPLPTSSLRRWVAPPLPLEQLPPLDVILVSHNHYDHLDAPTIRQLARLHPEASWLTPLGVGTLLRRLGARGIRELDWWQETEVGPARVAATPAQHFSARGIHDRNRTLWAGFTVRVGERAIYFAGDTGYFPEFGPIGQRFGPFDAVMLPIGAYEPRWFMRPVHMNPEEAVLAYRDLDDSAARGLAARGTTAEPMILLPIHWGTFKLTDEPMDEPPRRLAAAWAAAGLPPAALSLLPHGGTKVLGLG